MERSTALPFDWFNRTVLVEAYSGEERSQDADDEAGIGAVSHVMVRKIRGALAQCGSRRVGHSPQEREDDLPGSERPTERRACGNVRRRVLAGSSCCCSDEAEELVAEDDVLRG